ncbi:DNA-binding protein [Rhizobium bangladeshense]|uniref:DNA-binding protein n=1 Tax=Rhizobium bangladeshense TaxID=1138189 RepID=UPI001C917954|nr:DNA-binding protein [Rhizobium bangladeshense]MBY3597544.1 DNA-binding protein [Rhizobium bangladeshense]
MTTEKELKLDLIWEVAEIAKLIGRNERQTFHLLSSAQLPARKVGGRWVAERSKLIAFFMDPAA